MQHSLKTNIGFALKALAVISFGYFFWLMLKLTFEYIPAKSDVSFLMIKQTEVSTQTEYLTLFYIHVYSSIIVLLTGFLAITRFQFGIKAFHRHVGKIYIFLILFLAAPTGIYMAFFANGGWSSKISFVILGILWWWSTFKAFQLIKNKNFTGHRNWMWRSFAFAFSAVTLRLWKWVIVYFLHPNPMDVYQIVAWLGWIPNILFVELLIKKNKMMKPKNLLSISLLSLAMLSCKKEEQTKEVTAFEKETVVEIPEIHQELYGIYTGDFIGKYEVRTDDDVYEDYDYKKISLKINRITQDSVYGQSILNGNQRPFRGIYNKENQELILDEPGSDKTDGRFEVKITNDSLTGKWMAYDKSKVKAPLKTLKLIKKTFVYNPNFMLDEESTDLVDWTNSKEGTVSYKDEETGKTESYTSQQNRSGTEAIFKLNGSKRIFTEKELKNLRKIDLEIIKNAIYARHGYSFKKATFRNFFEQTDWYIPVSNDVENELTEIEKQNIVMLTRFIAYAEDKYDTFGR